MDRVDAAFAAFFTGMIGYAAAAYSVLLVIEDYNDHCKKAAEYDADEFHFENRPELFELSDWGSRLPFKGFGNSLLFLAYVILFFIAVEYTILSICSKIIADIFFYSSCFEIGFVGIFLAKRLHKIRLNKWLLDEDFVFPKPKLLLHFNEPYRTITNAAVVISYILFIGGILLCLHSAVRLIL